MIDKQDITNMTPEQIYTLYVGLRQDKELFAKVIMSHIVTEIPPYQHELYQVLNKGYQNLAVIAFRGSGKSTIGHTIDTTHDICNATSPFTIFISETLDQASADLISVQDELAANELIHMLYGNLSGNIWNKESMEAANGCYVMCRGTGSKIRGLKWKNQRPTKIKLDDVESEANTNTERQRKLFSDWIFTNVLRAGMPGETQFQFMGTIVHPDAFLAHAKDMPMFKEPNGYYLEIPVEKNGIPAWPSKFSLEWIEKEKASYAAHGKLPLFLQEMYNIPHSGGRAAFNTEMIRMLPYQYRQTKGISYLQSDVNKIPLNVYIGVDPADSANEAADDTCITVIGVLPAKNPRTELKKIVILDIQTLKANPSKVVTEIVNICDIYKPKLITFEVQGGRQAYIELLRTEMRRRGNYYAIKEFKTNVNKNNKWLSGLEPYINQGLISYLPSTRNINVLLNQLECFNTETREHDDTIDSLYLALENAYSPQEYDVDKAIKAIEDLEHEEYKYQAINWYTL